MKASTTAAMMPNSSLSRHLSHSTQSLSKAVECPKCNKRSIVMRSANTFDCLNCNFHKELPPIRKPYSSQRNQAQPTARERSPLAGYRSTQNPSQNIIFSSDPNLTPTEHLDTVTESDKAQPLVFAAIAVIFGILFL